MTSRGDLNARSLSLQSGDYVFGVTDSESQILTGGYQITVPDAPVNAFVYAKIQAITREQKFGANTATATLVDCPSATVAADQTQTGLRYKTHDGRWFPANRGPVEHDLLHQVVTTIRDGNSINVLVPGFDPRASVATAVDIALDVPQGSTIGLYSPGTRTHWGTKTNLSSEYERYGLSPKMGPIDSAVPLHTIIPNTTYSDGTLELSSTDSKLVFTKDLNELLVGPQLDYLVVNHLSHATVDDRERLEKLDSIWSDTPIVTLWSPFTKREYNSYPKYSPPFDLDDTLFTPDLASPQLDNGDPQTAVARASYQPSEEAKTLPAPPTTNDFTALCADHAVTFERLTAPSVTEALKETLSEHHNLEDAGSEQGANLVFNALMFFHRLPLPKEYYDDVIKQRSYDGEFFLPKTGDDYLVDIESHSTDGEYSLLHAQKTLEGLQYELQTNNPVFKQLIEYTRQARSENRRIAILANSKTSGELLKQALCSELSVDYLRPQVQVVNLDSARDIAPVDQFIICGPQPPSYSSFYLHPRADETTVLTYTDWDEQMIKRHVLEYAGNLETVLPRDVDVSLSYETVETAPGESKRSVDEDDEVSSKESEQSSPADKVPDNLSERDIKRLRTLGKLQPTKNDELADCWGYESGSELYQYLSSNLDPYYDRNHDYLIVLTAAGESILEALSSKS